MKLERRLFMIVLAACLTAPAVAQNVESGMTAWQAGRHDEAVRIWLPLGEAGSAEAQYRLGEAYRSGRGVPQNLRQAESWYQRASDQDHREARSILGLIMLHNGKHREAMPLIEEAAEFGDARAQYVLANALFHGDVVAPDRPRAFELMSRAVAQGLAAAAEQLREMEALLTLEESASAAALGRRTEAAEAEPTAPAPAEQVQVAEAPAAALPPLSPPPQPPTPEPQAMPSPAPAGKWRVQLGALDSVNSARHHWHVLRRAIPVLKEFEPSFEQADAFIRVRTGPFATRAAADRICAAARAAGKDCFVLQR